MLHATACPWSKNYHLATCYMRSPGRKGAGKWQPPPPVHASLPDALGSTAPSTLHVSSTTQTAARQRAEATMPGGAECGRQSLPPSPCAGIARRVVSPPPPQKWITSRPSLRAGRDSPRGTSNLSAPHAIRARPRGKRQTECQTIINAPNDNQCSDNR